MSQPGPVPCAGRARPVTGTAPASFCLCLALLVGWVAIPPAGAQSPAPLATGFINGKVEAGGTSMRYIVYVPRSFVPEKSWPVILFLHGYGADGHDGLRPVVGGLG